MAELFRKSTKKAGLPPGTLIYEGERKVEKIRITLIEYDENNVEEREVDKIEDCFSCRDKQTVSWINIDGLHDVELIEKLGTHFGIHPLVQEDITSVGQRPKMEEFEEYIFIIIRMLSYDDARNEVASEQVSLILTKNCVISFQEREGDVFEPVRNRIRERKTRIVTHGADYLAYALLDVVIDNYFAILENVGDRVEAMDDEIVKHPVPEMLAEIRRLKRGMIYLRKSVWPLREVVNALAHTETRLITKTTRIYLRDVYDHTIQVIDTVESLRDMISGILDIYMSSVSNRMNEVMKVLTIIATIFIPLTFIAGIYGMNFQYMPELKFHWSYPAVWGVMVVIGIVMIFFFKRKRWL